jgi:hypothetical protein
MLTIAFRKIEALIVNLLFLYDMLSYV